MNNKETPWKYPDPIYKPKDENELEIQLITCLKKEGWIVDNQVECEETKHWSNPWRADIICSRPTLGIGPIGIELKYFRHHKAGSKLFKTFKQMWKYHNKTFNGQKVKMWVIGTFFERDNHKSNVDEGNLWGSDAMREVIFGFFNNAGFGFLDLNRSELKIAFSGQGNNKKKLLIFNPYKDKRSQKSYGNFNFDDIMYDCIKKQKDFLKCIQTNKEVF